MAELTFVRINDLAAPPEPIHPLVIIEPFVAILIVANGIMSGAFKAFSVSFGPRIGAQMEDGWEDWAGWTFLECGFASFLILENLGA